MSQDKFVNIYIQIRKRQYTHNQIKSSSIHVQVKEFPEENTYFLIDPTQISNIEKHFNRSSLYWRNKFNPIQEHFHVNHNYRWYLNKIVSLYKEVKILRESPQKISYNLPENRGITNDTESFERSKREKELIIYNSILFNYKPTSSNPINYRIDSEHFKFRRMPFGLMTSGRSKLLSDEIAKVEPKLAYLDEIYIPHNTNINKTQTKGSDKEI